MSAIILLLIAALAIYVWWLLMSLLFSLIFDGLPYGTQHSRMNHDH